MIGRDIADGQVLHEVIKLSSAANRSLLRGMHRLHGG